jgi:coproporphyrinogen III oxidase-like Fe-S oxidoreductase
VHVPFCSNKCGFCDCYSFAVTSNVERTMERYLDAVSRELEALASQGPTDRRPVSTVHLGGGTPTYLGPGRLTRLIERCRSAFRLTAATELALETTAGALTPTMLDAMDAMGIRRVHVGVQSLDDEVRARIGRPDPAHRVLDRVGAALRRGWVVSVDLVCGLPGQRATGFVEDVERLVALGLDGFSLYELLIYEQNHAWARRYGLDERRHLPNFVAFAAAAQVLEAHGFRRNVFNHWANARDANVYFTSPARGEDCLAVGAIADGVVGDYHVRHPRFAAYLRGAEVDGVGLEGGLRRTTLENDVRPLVTSLLSGHLDAVVVEAVGRAAGGHEALTNDWVRRRLVDRDRAGGLTLTASGSWLAGTMVIALTDTVRARRPGRRVACGPMTPACG